MIVDVELSNTQTFNAQLMEAKTTIESDIKETVVSIHGMSAYQIAVEHGFEGTEEEWLASLVGLAGPQGPQGPQGEQGEKGYTPQKGTDYYTEEDKQELLSESELIANGAYAEAYIKTKKYTRPAASEEFITEFEITQVSSNSHIIKVNTHTHQPVVPIYITDGKSLFIHEERLSGMGKHEFEFNSKGAQYIKFDIGGGVNTFNVTYKQDANVVRAAINEDIRVLKADVGDIETALDTLIEQNENILAQQNAIIEMQNSLIGGDEA